MVTHPTSATDFVDHVDALRRTHVVGDERKADLGQFLTPAPVARFMSTLFGLAPADHLRLLDPGAGMGSLSAALIAEICARSQRPRSIALTAYEVDAAVLPHLRETMTACAAACHDAGISFSAQVRHENFVQAAAEQLRDGIFATPERVDWAILNPPYRKINTDSPERLWLRQVGVEVSNIYAGFLALTALLLEQDGEMVSITPRSFTNGPYFRPFRQRFLETMAPRHIHLFDRRDTAFVDDHVLQETVILHAVQQAQRPSMITMSSSPHVDAPLVSRRVPYEQFVSSADPEAMWHVVPDQDGCGVTEQMTQVRGTLGGLGLTVSTGRVVDFRARPWLRAAPEPETVPLIYPEHCRDGAISWPRAGTKKAQALARTSETDDLVVPMGVYVLVKRFSSKEERRRIVATVYDPERVWTTATEVGFENHLNYYHRAGAGLPLSVARGLALYLNSTIVDQYFRQFSGHTQVNATDLRRIAYPSREMLERVAQHVDGTWPEQETIDRIVACEVFGR